MYIKKEVIDKIEIVELHKEPAIQVRKATFLIEENTGETFGQPEYERFLFHRDSDILDTPKLVQDLYNLIYK